MDTIMASNRAKAVMLTIAGKPLDVQLTVITGAIRGATEQAAQIAEEAISKSDIATAIRATK